MSKLSFLDKQIEEREKPARPQHQVLCTISDDVTLNRQKFMEYLKKYPRARKFGFSKKHTKDIEAIKAHYGDSRSNSLVYGLPVEWNTEQSYLAV